jgi:hypothetical protein
MEELIMNKMYCEREEGLCKDMIEIMKKDDEKEIKRFIKKYCKNCMYSTMKFNTII